jgi:nucleotide-binding universal stress UspA family protein
MVSIKHILFPVDFSPQATQIAPFVRALAERFAARITLLAVAAPTFDMVAAGHVPRIGPDPTQSRVALQSRLAHALVGAFGDLPIERAVDAGDPALRIARYANAHAADLIMMPTHGVGLFRSLLIGSVTTRVLHDVTCPVWTAAQAEKAHSRPVPRTILCTVDGRAGSTHLLQWGAAFSERTGATLKVLHVVEPITDWPSLPHEQARQDDARRQARAKMELLQQTAGVVAPLRVAVGETVATVTEEARQEDADLILVGRGVVNETLGRLRTHAFGIVQRSPCPVLSV